MNRDFVSLAWLFSPRAYQVVSTFVAEELEAVKIVLSKECLVLNVLDDVLLKHFLADHQHFLLVGPHSISQPVVDLGSTTAHGVLAKPTVLVILHPDVFVHDVGPLLEVLQLIVFDLSVASSAAIVFLDNFGLRVLFQALV